MAPSHKSHFTRLTIAGFKSFADEVTVEILPGLTGIIGPNGCGKSNIVDALRWVMGESSAKALRGGDSDDLIFAGTSARPARSLAQVSVQLDDAQGLAQPPFQDCGELVITRQAERGSNSTYRLNNTIVRAKDIQMLFADMDSGARSSAIISQNRVSQIIEVKPEERRVLLEEAAGIKGLYVRRKDAETKLKQAQTNLEQAQAQLDTLRNRIKTLSEQSQQAQTYRSLSESIRTAEAQLLTLQHHQARTKVEASQKELFDAKASLETTNSLLSDKKNAFETLQQDEKAKKDALEQLRPRLEEQKLQMEIAQNNLSHIQKSWDERTQSFNELTNALDEKTSQLKTLLAQEADYNKDLATLKEGYDPSIDLSVEKQKLDTEEKALDNAKSAYDKAKDDYHQATLDYETIRSQCDNLRQHFKQSQTSLDQIQSELQKNEEICLNSTLITEAENQASQTRQALKQAEQDRVAYADLCQNQKIAVTKAKATLENIIQGQKHLSTQGDLISERLKILEIRRQRALSEQKTLSTSITPPEELEAKKQKLSAARDMLAQVDSQEKAAREEKDKQEEIWLKFRTTQKETLQKKTVIELEIKRLEHLQQTTAQHLAEARKLLSEVLSQKDSYSELETNRNNLSDKQKIYDDLSQDISSWRESLKSSFSKLADTRKQLHQQELQLLQIKGEASGLERSLELSSEEDSPSLLKFLDVAPDYAHALAAALTNGLNATLISDDSIQKKLPYKRAWRTLPHGETLLSPLSGLQTLADFVKAPPALSRALNAIYILEETSQGPVLQAALSPGTSLVARDGSFWRWDGYVQSASVEPSEIRQLQNLQRLRELRDKSDALEQTTKEVQAMLDDEQNRNKTLQAQIEKKRDEAISLERDLSHLRFQVREQEHGHELSDKRLQFAQTQVDKDTATANEIRDNIASLKESLAELNDVQCDDHTQEQKIKDVREAVIQAHNKRTEVYKNFSVVERDYTQAQLQADNTQSRLKDISASLKHIESDFQTLSQQQKDFETDLSRLNLVEAQKKLTEAQTDLNDKLATLARMETRCQALQADSERARNKLNVLTQQQSTSLGRRDTLREQVKTQQALCLTLDNNLKQASARMDSLPPLEEKARTLETLQVTFEKNRLAFQEHRTAYEALEQKTRTITEQLQAITLKLQNIEADKKRLSQELHDLKQKKQAFELSQQSQENPAQLAQQVEELKANYDNLKAHYDECDQELSSLSKTLETSRDELNSLQSQHTAMREKSSALTERLTQVQNQFEQLQTQNPLPPQTEQDPSSRNDLSGKNEPSLRRDITRLQQEREKLGTVNLKAQEDHDAALNDADTIEKELSELTEAINAQQKIISTINREGRSRLNAVFADVDQHFQTLFSRIFGGGKAHLAMVGSDDPLEAGLEIYAQPPGKKLSTLSLLSGGEQALTALSLIFAAFFCNPAPICVLDEIDAPLDENNVEQFCRLIIDINKQTETRFLVVTHHQVTMAHMNQLYGVTMQERGVSRILSVSLDDSLKFIGS